MNPNSVSGVLVVPVHLDALVLEADRLMVEAMADFSRLPYVDPHLKREINADNANISESIVSQPFQSQNLHLKAGVHLHWSMPDALTRGLQHSDETRFPALPNRWLVTRSQGETSRKSWVVQSDYVSRVFRAPKKNDSSDYVDYVLGTGERPGGISYYYREIDPDSPEPFRYVGRQLPLELWLKESQDQSASYFPADKPLTALGYGEIAFAAFYPNCHSVFGFHDDDAKVVADTSGYQYEIIGWHSDENHDPVTGLLLGEAILNCFTAEAARQDQAETAELFLRSFNGAATKEPKKELSDIIDRLIAGDSLRSELREFLVRQSQDFISEGLAFFQKGDNTKFLAIEKLEDFNWILKADSNGGIPVRTIYYSSVSFPKKSGSKRPDAEGEVKISVGNTTMEALSAYLAHQIASEFGIKPQNDDYAKRMERLEDQLESLHLSGKLSNRKLDIGPKFREARHNSGFTPVSSGVCWAVRLQSRSPECVTPSSLGKNGSDAEELHKANAAHAQAQRRVILPPEMTTQLSKLNDLQNKYDRVQHEIGARRKQLFSDWYKYMLSAYHPADTIRGDDYPDVDEVQFFIEENDIKPLEKIIGKAKHIETGLKDAKEQLQKLIDHYNNSLIVHLRPMDAGTPGPLGRPAGVDAASFRGRLEHNLPFSKDTKAAASNTNPAFAKCLSFNGNDSFAKVKWEAPPSKARPGVTLSAWIKPHLKAWVEPNQKMEGNHTVFAIGQLVIQLQPITRGATSRLAVACPEVDERIGAISPGRWHHLAITCENSDALSLVVYIDGRRFPLQPDKEVSEKLNKFDPLFIGASKESDTSGYQGKMTQVRVDNRALLPAEVRRDMNGGARPVYQLYKKAAPRYWQPNEPVILMVGKGIRATERHGQDGVLECPVIALPSDDALNKLITGVQLPVQKKRRGQIF